MTTNTRRKIDAALKAKIALEAPGDQTPFARQMQGQKLRCSEVP